jgi:mannose-6-phosphate isomerase-like protein (cupin superfamily)
MEPTKLETQNRRPDETSQAPNELAQDIGEVADIGPTRVRFLVRSSVAAGAFSLIEYAIPPRTLIAPAHRHTWEDEYSFVLQGRVAVLLGDDVVHAETGEVVLKPRRLWHTIWNPGDEPCRILETISPGGFEHFFDELAARVQQPTGQSPPTGELGARYGIDTDFESVQALCSAHGLHSPLPTPPRKLDAGRGR